MKFLTGFQYQKFLILIFITISCKPEEEMVIPLPSNECCFDGKCINLREGYITMLSNSSNSTVTAFQVNLTSGGLRISADQTILVFNSNNLNELSPGKYVWKDFNLHEPNSITYGMMIDVTAKPVDLFGHGSFDQDTHMASQGYVIIKKTVI